jgi:hypothetical protein
VGGYLSFTPTTLYVETECLPPPSNGEANKVKFFRTSSCPVDSLNLNHLSSSCASHFGQRAHLLALRAIQHSLLFVLAPLRGRKQVGGYLSFTPTTLYVETECLPPPSNGEANKVKFFRTSSCPVDSLNLNHLSSSCASHFGQRAHLLALRAIQHSLLFVLAPLRGRKQVGGVSILHPHHTLRRNRVSASPLKWGGEQGEILSHQLLPCGLA